MEGIETTKQNSQCTEVLPRRVKQQRKEAKPYYEQLKDPRWQKKRLEILERDGWQCQACGAKEQTLHVHHKAYQNGKKPWEYGDHCLVTLCEACHKANRDVIEESQRWICRLKPAEAFWINDQINEALEVHKTVADDSHEISIVRLSRIMLALAITRRVHRAANRDDNFADLEFDLLDEGLV